MTAGFFVICHNKYRCRRIAVNNEAKGVGMFTSILLTVALSQVAQNSISVNPIPKTQPEPIVVQSQTVQFDTSGLQADIHAELLLQIERLSQAISDNIEEGILPTAPVELMTVKD